MCHNARTLKANIPETLCLCRRKMFHGFKAPHRRPYLNFDLDCSEEGEEYQALPRRGEKVWRPCGRVCLGPTRQTPGGGLPPTRACPPPPPRAYEGARAPGPGMGTAAPALPRPGGEGFPRCSRRPPGTQTLHRRWRSGRRPPRRSGCPPRVRACRLGSLGWTLARASCTPRRAQPT